MSVGSTARVITRLHSETTDKTDGYYRRAIVAEFRNKFEDMGKGVIDTIPEREYENYINKSIRVLSELLERGKFKDEGTTEEKMKKYEALSNPFETFQREILREDDILRETPISDLRDCYNLFSKAKGFRPMNEIEFGRKISQAYETARKHFGDKYRRVVLGVYADFRQDAKPLDSEQHHIQDDESHSGQDEQDERHCSTSFPICVTNVNLPVHPVHPVQNTKSVTELEDFRSKVFSTSGQLKTEVYLKANVDIFNVEEKAMLCAGIFIGSVSEMIIFMYR